MLITEVKDELKLFCSQRQGEWPLVFVDEVSSTNNLAMEMAKEGAESGTVVVADLQTEGRGRLGKQWQSHAGCGVYLSIILRPKVELQDLAKITLVTGVALVETVACLVRARPMLKWPNDLIINDQKCAGILVESETRVGQSPLVIIGIGINIHRPQHGYGDGLRLKAGCLNDCGNGFITRSEFLAGLLPVMQGVMGEFEDGQGKRILTRWRRYDYTLSKRLTWLTTGGDVVEGVSCGIDPEGMLYIIDDSGVRHGVLSGDIQLTHKSAFEKINRHG